MSSYRAVLKGVSKRLGIRRRVVSVAVAIMALGAGLSASALAVTTDAVTPTTTTIVPTTIPVTTTVTTSTTTIPVSTTISTSTTTIPVSTTISTSTTTIPVTTTMSTPTTISMPTSTTTSTTTTTSATTTSATTPTPAPYSFRTLDNPKDPAFNQLLGIDNEGLIAGYFGSGANRHPNQGYLLRRPYDAGSYLDENFPHSAQTQVTGLNNLDVTVGFWADRMGDNFGFYAIRRHNFRTADFPGGSQGQTRVDQLLGVNDRDVAVGFYDDATGNAHGYTYRIREHRYEPVRIPGATSVTAAAINNLDDIVGFETERNGDVVGFLRQSDGTLIKLSYPGATQTEALGVNDGDEAVGAYTDGTGSGATTHGFVWRPGWGFKTVDDPNGIGTTTPNGVNDRGQLVGFYVDGAGNTEGMLATPQTFQP